MNSIAPQTFNQVLERQGRAWNRTMFQFALVLAVVLTCSYYVGLFDLPRLADGIPSIFSLGGDMMPPDFSQADKWVKYTFPYARTAPVLGCSAIWVVNE